MKIYDLMPKNLMPKNAGQVGLFYKEKRVLIWVISLICSLVGINFVLLSISNLILNFLNKGKTGIKEIVKIFDTPTSMLIVLATAIIFIPVSIFIYRWLTNKIQHRPCWELAMRGTKICVETEDGQNDTEKRSAIKEFLYGVLIGAVLVSLPVIIMWIFGFYHVTGIQLRSSMLGGIYMGISAAFLEEFLIRGLLLRCFEKIWGTGVGLAMSCALFGVGHIFNQQISIVGVVAIGVEAGLLLGVAYLYTRRLWLPIGIHFAWNCVQSTIWSSTVSGVGEVKGLLDVQFTGPEWVTGGSTGIEGSLITVVICVLASAIMGKRIIEQGNYLPIGGLNSKKNLKESLDPDQSVDPDQKAS